MILRHRCVSLPENIFWIEQILQRPSSKYPKIKTFFIIDSLCLPRKCQVKLTEFKHRHRHDIIFCSYDINFFTPPV